eukprot:g14687.t1
MSHEDVKAAVADVLEKSELDAVWDLGCTLFTVLLFLVVPFFFAPCWYVLCCWQEPIMGVHYGKKAILVAQGGVAPQVVVAAGEGSEDEYEE